MRSLALVVVAAALPALAAPPAPKAIDRAALQRLVEHGRASHSSALVVWQRGKIVVEEYFGTPPHPGPLMSCTKSVVALAVAKLVDQGKLKSFDQPVSDFYPEWKQGQKRAITLRHLLTHTSGMQNVPNNTPAEIYPAPDAIKLALAAELSDPPGTRFEYNNKAMNLLAGVIQLASGRRMDRYVEEEILRPLGIVDGKWEELDKAGNPYAMSGLSLTAAGFIKIGRLVLGNGAVDGKRVLSEASARALVAQGTPLYPGYGLGWWRVPRWHVSVVDDTRLAEMKRAGVDEKFVAAMATLKDRPLRSEEDVETALRQALGDDWQPKFMAARKKCKLLDDKWSPDFIGWTANGYLGQYLVVLPKAELVAVRMVDPSERYDDKTDGFDDFFHDVRALVDAGAQ